MPITPTTNLSLNMYADGDNPGAGGTASSAPTNTGLNGNWHKLDAVVGVVIDTSGNIKDNKVTTSSINASAVTAAKIGTNAVTSEKINALAVTNDKIANNSILKGKINADAIEGNTMALDGNGRLQVKSGGVNTTQLTDDAVTSAKISHDNNRTKNTFIFIWDMAVADGYYKHQGVLMTANLGISMPRAGAVTKITICKSDGNTLSNSTAYVTSGDTHFDALAKLTAYNFGSDGKQQVRINGAIGANGLTANGSITNPSVCLIEVEFDD